jgi:hypothetical protein
VGFRSFCADPVSELAYILGINIENLCDFIGCPRRYDIGFGEFKQEDDLVVARLESLPFIPAQQVAYILGCPAAGT